MSVARHAQARSTGRETKTSAPYLHCGLGEKPDEILAEIEKISGNIFWGGGGAYLRRWKLRPGSLGGAPLMTNCHLSGPMDFTRPTIAPCS
jgi:hypothetical protein